MYNRYIPQADGTYQRNRMPDKAKPPEARPPERRPPSPSASHLPPPAPPAPVCPPPPSQRRESRPQAPAPGVGSFLKGLLPKDFDTEDLLVILLFLLMSRDSEDQNSTLLTLALYLFL